MRKDRECSPSSRWRLCGVQWCLYEFSEAAISKYPSLCLKHRHLFSHCSGGWKSKIKVSFRLGSSEASLPGLEMAAFSLCPLMAERELGCLFLLQGHQSYQVRTSPCDLA